MNKKDFDYDLIIIGGGVGGHAAAVHGVKCGLKTVLIEMNDMGGTCVNRGCIPSKALLAAAKKVRELQNLNHLQKLGIQVDEVKFDREKIADHATNLVNKIRQDLTNSLKHLKVEIIYGQGKIIDNQTVNVLTNNSEQKITAKNIILSPGSSPFVPPGIEIDHDTVFTSDEAVKLKQLPEWIAIIGSGYIGLEFSDIYTALGCEVTIVEALDNLIPGFDTEISKFAQRKLIDSRNIETYSGVFASKIIPGKPVVIELTDVKTKQIVDILEVDSCLVATGRIPTTSNLGLDNVGIELEKGFIPINNKMQVINNGQVIPHIWSIGDATGKMMLAHVASGQGVIAVENICGRSMEIDYRSIPAATFTEPEISYVGLTESAARELGKLENFEITSVKAYFKGNSKALAEGEADGFVKVIFRKDSGELLGVHIIGSHASDLIQEAANSIGQHQTVQNLAFNIHTHPTLSEVLDNAYKKALTVSNKN
ncbi:MAG: dihydrolipoamide dehydrogenase [Candidatus Atelocyanobacterium thalassa isolate SIO64986]|uniref:Dihydrolipoyl dehydrogenase n=1 Tax=Candidatus Atelocyanobacterium thalassa isolate SIO64986 TaxID=1527444 RepID=A0A086CIM6_9CHRO|nr:MAG: dihydrolipoamide dehydrogenase [Candidatus Atelocyanobacterium thalassa isolate SIO64986]